MIFRDESTGKQIDANRKRVPEQLLLLLLGITVSDTVVDLGLTGNLPIPIFAYRCGRSSNLDQGIGSEKRKRIKIPKRVIVRRVKRCNSNE